MDKNRGARLAGRGEAVLLTYADPLAKAAVLAAEADAAGGDVVYLDFDLMRAGHVASGTLAPSRAVAEVRAGAGVCEAMAAAISRASRGTCLVILDTLNGMHRAAGAGAEMAVNASVMMLASVARRAGSAAVIACAARAEAGGGLVMVPLGRRVVAVPGAVRARAVTLRGGGAAGERLGGTPQTPLWEPLTSL